VKYDSLILFLLLLCLYVDYFAVVAWLLRNSDKTHTSWRFTTRGVLIVTTALALQLSLIYMLRK
jgi:hypothetical protein